MPKKIERARTQSPPIPAHPKAFPTLTLDFAYISITGGVAAGVLFAWFERAFHEAPPGTTFLRAPLKHWRMDGYMSPVPYYAALRHFGYTYLSRLEYRDALAAGRKWINPFNGHWLLYVLVHDLRTDTVQLLRNATLIDRRIDEVHGVRNHEPLVPDLQPNEAARTDARRLLADFSED